VQSAAAGQHIDQVIERAWATALQRLPDARAAHRHEPVACESDALRTDGCFDVIAGTCIEQPQIERLAPEVRRLLQRRDRHLHARQRRLQSREPWRQPQLRHGRQGRHLQGAAPRGGLGFVAQRLDRKAELVDRGAERGECAPPVRTEANALAVALEQRAAGPGLQGLDLLRDGGRRDEQLFGRTREAAVARRGLEGADSRVRWQARAWRREWHVRKAKFF